MSAIGSINDLFDALPRTRITVSGRQLPAFRCCGIAGFYAALIVVAAATLLTGRSLAVGVLISAVAAGSFFVWAFFRRRVSGGEKLVLLEHVWFALALVSGALWLVHQPVLTWLDIMAPALALFLSAGRIGCTLVGCCHGHPSSVGIVYKDSAVADGFPAEFVGSGLFPVQAIEGFALLLIGLSGLAALPFARPGEGLIWFLIAYAVVRFGLEALRADPRPHFLGWSQSQWMCIGQGGVAIILSESGNTGPAVWAVLGLILPAVMIWKAVSDRRGGRSRLLRAEHIQEMRDLVIRDLRGASHPWTPAARQFPRCCPCCLRGFRRRAATGACVAFSYQRPWRSEALVLRGLRGFSRSPRWVNAIHSGPRASCCRSSAVRARKPIAAGERGPCASDLRSRCATAQSDASAPKSRGEELRVVVRDMPRPVARPMADPEEPLAAEPHPRQKKPWYFGLSGSERE